MPFSKKGLGRQMMSKLLRNACAAAVLSLGLASGAWAAPVYGLAADLTGSRSVASGQLLISNGDSDWSDVVIAWSILDNGDGTYDYSYTLTGFDKPDISHFVIDLTDDIEVTSETVTNARLNGSALAGLKVVVESDGSISDPSSGYSIYGAIKLDDGVAGTNVYTFTSDRAPVWGDVIAKGSTQYLSNKGHTDHSSGDVNWFVARPDGQGTTPGPTPIPLPASVWAGMALLGGLGLVKLHARRRQLA